MDALICIAEHTCGMDSKMHFADYDHYLKKDFKAARSEDKVKIKHLFTSNNNINLIKISDEIDPKSVASKGRRTLHAVFGTELACDNRNYRIINHHSPLVSIGRGKILQFDNKFESAETDGITYVLYNNVWGTNFSLWYEDNARFLFEISK